MREDIIDDLHREVERRCKLPTNFFGMGCYYHIESVVKNAERLAKQYGADIEIVMIASWLHDIASITDYRLYEKHHIYGAQIAKELLSSFDYEDCKIERVQKCILHHRGSIEHNRLTLEEMCVADADAISHFVKKKQLETIAGELQTSLPVLAWRGFCARRRYAA